MKHNSAPSLLLKYVVKLTQKFNVDTQEFNFEFLHAQSCKHLKHSMPCG